MADQKAVSMTAGHPGVEVVIWYNDVNDRIGNVEWTITSSVAVTTTIWDTNVSSTVPVINRTETTSGSETVPGNYRMEEVTENGDTYMDLPSNILYQFNVQGSGG